MNTIELFLLALGLSMDAFAVSICKGLSLGHIRLRHMLIAGAWFGGPDANAGLSSGQFLFHLYRAVQLLDFLPPARPHRWQYDPRIRQQ